MFFSLGPDVTDFGELADGSKEVHYRVTFSFYIWTMTTEDWEDWIKFRGGVDIACSLVSLIACIIGLVGVQMKKPILVYIFSCGVGLYIGMWVADIFGFALKTGNFTISSGLAWTLTVVLMIATSSLVYFPLCVYSLYLKFCKEKKGEIEQVPDKNVLYHTAVLGACISKDQNKS